jgi:urease accessory protein
MHQLEMLADRSSTFARNRAVGRVELAVKASGAVTRRDCVHEAGSLRVRFPGAPARELEAVLLNTAGGIAGGDRFDVVAEVREDAALLVTTAAAEKVYRAIANEAEIGIRLAVARGASLCWLPQETIVFDRIALSRRIDVELEDDARLLLAEALVFGREAMGETVRQGRIIDRWRVRRGNQLCFAETLRLDGDIAERLGERAVAAGGIAVATVLIVPGEEAQAAAVRALEGLSGEVGISVWNGIAVARLLARDGASLRADLARVVGALRKAPLPRLWVN